MNTQTIENGTESAAPSGAEFTRSGQYFRPRVDIVEQEQELCILADMPGVSADSIDIDFVDGNLTIHGRVPQRQGEQVKYLLKEYGIGDFYRVFQIGEAIDPSKINAEYADGVLTVHLPKIEAVKPRRINVQAK